MIFDDEIALYQRDATARGVAHVEAFMARWGLDRAALETFVRRSVRDGQLYYVSTVPRGLGGSTSDIDFMVIAQARADGASNLTSLLFHQGWRVGVKTLTVPEVEAALAAVEERLAAWEQGAYLVDPLPMKWINLERAVNGLTFDGEPRFADRLPTLSRWGAAMAFVDFNRNALLADLAAGAGQARAARAYGEATVMAAMDAIMAACGRVQWNSKWIYERWSVFAPEVADPRVQLGIRLIERLRAAVETTPAPHPVLREAMGEMRAYLLDGDPAWSRTDRARLTLAPRVTVDGFLPGAVTLQGAAGALVVDKAALDGVLDGEADSRIAPIALSLAQKGFLQVDFQRSQT